MNILRPSIISILDMGNEGLAAYVSKALRHLICFKYFLGFGPEMVRPYLALVLRAVRL